MVGKILLEIFLYLSFAHNLLNANTNNTMPDSNNYMQFGTIFITVILLIIIFYLIQTIKQRKKLENDFSLITHEFKATFNLSTHLIGLLDTNGKLILANKTSLDLINAKNDDVYMQYFWNTPWWKDSKEDQHKLKDGFKNALNNEITNFQTVHFDAQKNAHYVNFTMKPYTDDTNKIMFIIVESTDISDVRLAQNKIQELNEQLELKIKTRTKELEDANSELENTLIELKETQEYLIHTEKMASLGDLVAGIAHEINTPIGMGLTGITHFMEISKEVNELYKSDEMSQEDFEEYLDETNQLSKSINISLLKAVDLIKSFKEIAVDQSSEAQRTFNMKEYIDEILLSLHHEIKREKHTITIDCPENLVITSHPGAFSQIITNLVMNSFVHAFKDKDHGNILIELQLDDNLLFLTYTDDGKGIKQENLSKVFDPFFTTNRNHGGSGLGLNIIFNIVNTTLKGKIECSSLENIGVEFKIVIPLGKEEKE